jgi:hypothetical protein
MITPQQDCGKVFYDVKLIKKKGDADYEKNTSCHVPVTFGEYDRK